MIDVGEKLQQIVKNQDVADSKKTPSDSTNQTPREGEEFILQLAEALHQYGTPSHELEDALQACSEQLRMPAAFFSTPTAIFISFPESKENRTILRRVNPGGIDLEKLVSVHKLVTRFLDGKTDVATASIQLNEIANQNGSFSQIASIASFAVASGSVVSFFGGGLREIMVTATIGLIVGSMELIARKNQDFARAYSAVAAASASFLAVLASRFIPGLSSEIITLGSLIVLIPGLTVTIAVSELVPTPRVRNVPADGSHPAIYDARFWSCIWTKHCDPAIHSTGHSNECRKRLVIVGLRVDCAVFVCRLVPDPKKDVGLVFVTCILGFLAGRLGSVLLGNELGPAFGSFTIAVFSNIVSRIYRQPSALTLVPGLMFLVPGSIGFLSLQSFVQHDTINGIQSAFSVLFIAAALVSGLLADFLVQPRRWQLSNSVE